MRSLIRILQASAVLACVLALFSPQVNATRVKSGSGYGPFGNCTFGQSGSPIAPSVATIGGLTVLSEDQFCDDVDPGATFDVFDLGEGGISSPTTISLAGATFGLFTCGFSATSSAEDSDGFPTGVPCSPIGSIDSPTIGIEFFADDVKNGAGAFDFTLNSNGSLTFDAVPVGDELVVFDEAPTATPEPATVTMIGLGFLVLAGLVVRRSA